MCYFTLCGSFLYRSLCKPKLNCLLYCLQDYKWLFVQRSWGQRSNANRLETLSLCVQAWLCKADHRLICESKKSENSVVLTPSVCIARAVPIGFGVVRLVVRARKNAIYLGTCSTKYLKFRDLFWEHFWSNTMLLGTPVFRPGPGSSVYAGGDWTAC